MLAVTDAVTLMPSVSGLVFVLGAEMTTLGAAERALNLLRAAGPADVGVVLNRVNFNGNKFYYHRYYGYKQQEYYDQAPARMPEIEGVSLTSPPQGRSRLVSAVPRWAMVLVAGAVCGLAIGAALLQSPLIDEALPALPRAQLNLASATPPPPVAFGGTLPGSGSTPALSSAESYVIVAASFPDASAAMAVAAMLKELDYRVRELTPSATAGEFLVVVGPYTDLDRARQDEAQLRSRLQLRNAKIVTF